MVVMIVQTKYEEKQVYMNLIYGQIRQESWLTKKEAELLSRALLDAAKRLEE